MIVSMVEKSGTTASKALRGHWAHWYPSHYLSQAVTSSQWTQSHILPYLCFAGVSVMNSMFLFSGLSLKT